MCRPPTKYLAPCLSIHRGCPKENVSFLVSRPCAIFGDGNPVAGSRRRKYSSESRCPLGNSMLRRILKQAQCSSMSRLDMLRKQSRGRRDAPGFLGGARIRKSFRSPSRRRQFLLKNPLVVVTARRVVLMNVRLPLGRIPADSEWFPDCGI